MIGFNRKFGTSLGIALAALVISTLGIAASDELSGVSGRLAATLGQSKEVCEAGTTLVAYGSHAVCMDIYEAVPGTGCLYQDPKSELETEVNVANEKCQAVSVENRVPWRYVAYTEAAQLCARSGKRLPTNDEWYKVALGLPGIADCVLEADAPKPGVAAACVTSLGVVNTVGNVWEWMAETISDNSFASRPLPPSGYVTMVDESGVVLTTDTVGDTSFGNDYATIGVSGVQGMLRGGFYGSKDDGGIFSQNFAAPLSLTAVGVGFRCVRDVW